MSRIVIYVTLTVAFLTSCKEVQQNNVAESERRLIEVRCTGDEKPISIAMAKELGEVLIRKNDPKHYDQFSPYEAQKLKDGWEIEGSYRNNENLGGGIPRVEMCLDGSKATFFWGV